MMKRTTALTVLLVGAASVATAEVSPRAQLDAMAGGVGTGAMMDGCKDGKCGSPMTADEKAAKAAADALKAGTTPDDKKKPASPADLNPNRKAPPPPKKNEPGFFSKAGSFLTSKTFLASGAGAAIFGAAGFMVAGPLGLLTGALIGGLLGFLVSKAL